MIELILKCCNLLSPFIIWQFLHTHACHRSRLRLKLTIDNSRRKKDVKFTRQNYEQNNSLRISQRHGVRVRFVADKLRDLSLKLSAAKGA